MNASRAAYWQGRALLQQQSAQLRHSLEQQVQALAPAWQVLDGTQRGVAWVRQRPWVLALGLRLLARKPRTALRWGWRSWRAWRWAQHWLGGSAGSK